MNRHEFMEELKKRLRKLPFDEIKEAVDYYEQYFEDAGEENEQSVLADLGPPSNVASQIIADFAVKGAGMETKRGLSTVFLVILAVFASPIALPLALAVVAVAFAAVAVLLAVVVSVGAASLGLLAGGLAYMVISIPTFLQNPAMALSILGIGLAAFGIGLAFGAAAAILAKKCLGLLSKHMGRFILRRNSK